MPDGSVSTVPARVNAMALGDVVLEVTGQLKIQDPGSVAARLDQIEFNVLSGAGQVDIIALQGVGLLYALTDQSITVTDQGIDANGDFVGTTYTGVLRFENSGPGTATISGTEAWAIEFSVGRPIQVSRTGGSREEYEIEAISSDGMVITVVAESAVAETSGELTGDPHLTFASNVTATLSPHAAVLSPAANARLADDPRTVTPAATTFSGAVIAGDPGTWAGFAPGDTITVRNSLSNDGVYHVASVSHTELTLTDAFFTAEDDTIGVTIRSDRTVTFASNTIHLSRGNWLDDGFAAGDVITAAGSLLNDGHYQIAFVSGDGQSLILTASLPAPEAISSPDVTLTGDRTVTFASDTISLSRGSWLSDGFAAGDIVSVERSASNDGRYQVRAISPDGRILQLASSMLSAEVTSSLVLAITGAPAVTLARKALSDGEIATVHSELEFTTTEIGRSTGDWIADGFSPGDTVVVDVAGARERRSVSHRIDLSGRHQADPARRFAHRGHCEQRLRHELPDGHLSRKHRDVVAR